MSIHRTRKSELERCIEELRKELKKAEKEHSENWMLMHSLKKKWVFSEDYCYNKMAVDDALVLISKTARMFRRLSDRAKDRKKKLTSRK